MHQVKHFSIFVLYNLPSVGGKDWRKHCNFSVTAAKEVSLLKKNFVQLCLTKTVPTAQAPYNLKTLGYLDDVWLKKKEDFQISSLSSFHLIILFIVLWLFCECKNVMVTLE